MLQSLWLWYNNYREFILSEIYYSYVPISQLMYVNVKFKDIEDKEQLGMFTS